MVEETEAQGAQYGPTISSGGIELLVHSLGCLPDRFFKEFSKLKKKNLHKTLELRSIDGSLVSALFYR